MHDGTRLIEVFVRKGTSFEGAYCANDAASCKDRTVRKFGDQSRSSR